MSKLVSPPGGGGLKALLAPRAERAALLARAQGLTKVPMTSREVSDVLMLAMGAYTPLDGFMGKGNWRRVCLDMKLKNGVFWPIPITLSSDKALADSIHVEEEVALTCLSEGDYPKKYPELYIRPAQARAMFQENGWSAVAAFQTRNPMQRAHEHLVKIAIEVTDGVFIHQVLGKLKPGDIPADVRTDAIQAMIDNYFVEGTVIQAGYPIEMRYAGPREALLHALIRQNYGCSHLIVGRDHAGVGDYYGPFDAHHIFDTLWEGALKTRALKIDITFYCNKCFGMATGKTCPHDDADRIHISGTQQRAMLEEGAPVPPEFGRPEVIEILRKYYAGL
jgi:sulfate adenylyltransferase